MTLTDETPAEEFENEIDERPDEDDRDEEAEEAEEAVDPEAETNELREVA